VRARAIDPNAPRPDPEISYGAYLLAVSGCTFCHGLDLKGGQGPEPGAPPAADITAAGAWGDHTFEQFAHTVRTGIKPDGGHIQPAYMPWVGYSRITDEDLMAIWNYLQSLN
jgi:mono/diheme cytochrome c family protein